MKAWLKGGIIAGIFWIILFLMNMRGWNQMITIINVPIIDIIFIFLFYLMVFFLIGGLLGLIIGLIANKLKSKPNRAKR